MTETQERLPEKAASILLSDALWWFFTTTFAVIGWAIVMVWLFSPLWFGDRLPNELAIMGLILLAGRGI